MALTFEQERRILSKLAGHQSDLAWNQARYDEIRNALDTQEVHARDYWNTELTLLADTIATQHMMISNLYRQLKIGVEL